MYADYSTSTICRSALRNVQKKGRRQQHKKKKKKKATTAEVSHGNLVDSSSDDDDDDNNRGIKTSLSTSLHDNILLGGDIVGEHDGLDETVKASTTDAPPDHHHLPMTALRQYSSEPLSYVTGGANNNNNHNPPHQQHSTSTSTTTTTALFPKCITPQIISQLRTYVYTICSQYHNPNHVPYHNVEHAYHVFLSANKLLDLMLCEFMEEDGEEGDDDELLKEDSSDDDEDDNDNEERRWIIVLYNTTINLTCISIEEMI